MWRVASVAAISVLCVAGLAEAGEMAPPRITRADVDWAGAAQAVGAVVASRALDAAETPSIATAMARINAITAARLPGLAQSPIPVLLPFDIDAYMRDRSPSQVGPARLVQSQDQVGPARLAQSQDQVGPARLVQNSARLDPTRDPDALYYAGFGHPAFFAAGPSGFDASFRFSLARMPELADIRFARTVDIAISGSSLIYDLAAPLPDQGVPVAALEADFPGIRRSYVEDYVRYTFMRYGVPYVVSTDCFDGAFGRYHQIACRDADRVIQLFLHKLRIVGGTPQPTPQAVVATAPPLMSKSAKADLPARPDAASPIFTYYGPGRLVPGTGYRHNAGRSDDTVYSTIRFPLAAAPAFANTQYFARRVAGGARAYPWRDNFCESRSFWVSQCPGGHGHQGQDIRGGCNPASLGDDRCAPHQNDVVAAHDGVILRASGQEAVWLIVNTANEHIRFRYLHMRPKLLDAEHVLNNRAVTAGEVIGQIGNFSGHENGTSYHLHFDIQVPTRMGWIYVNPYITLVSAYERLIGGRGTELSDAVLASAAPTVNDGSAGGTTFTPASAGPATLVTSHVAPAPAAARCRWRARHWRGCGAHAAVVAHHFRGFRRYRASRRHYRGAASYRYRRHHI